MGYVIVTDSALDIEREFLYQRGICTVPLSFTLEGADSVEDDFGATVPFSEFYRQLREGKTVTTAQAPLAAFLSVFEGILKSRRDVVYLGLSSALSENYQTACKAKRALEERYRNRVYCVDTRAAAGGQTLLVRAAAARKAAGDTAEQLVEWAEEFRAHVVHWFLVDDLRYLTDERLPGSVGGMGARMNVKPVLYLSDEGKPLVWKKARGSKRAIELLGKQLAAHIREIGAYPVTISHADCPADAETLKQYILSHTAVQEVELHTLDAITGAHVGPGALAVFCYGDKRG